MDTAASRGMMRNLTDVISPDHKAEQMILHARPEGFGGKGRRYVGTVRYILEQFGAYSVLDYGCGQGSLACALRLEGVECREFDPGITGKDAMPMFADLVVCTDVLEHVEMDKLANVIRHIGSLARKAVFVVVALEDTHKRLTDGRSAHLIIRPAAWWDAKFQEFHWTRVEYPNLPLPPMSPEKLEKRFIAVYQP